MNNLENNLTERPPVVVDHTAIVVSPNSAPSPIHITNSTVEINNGPPIQLTLVSKILFLLGIGIGLMIGGIQIESLNQMLVTYVSGCILSFATLIWLMYIGYQNKRKNRIQPR